MQTTRRIFLKSGALALASVGLTPGFGLDFLRSTVFAAEKGPNPKKRKILVCIFLRGAVDGLSLVVPHGDPDYYRLRQNGPGGIAIPRSGEGKILDLDGKFGLHPALLPLKTIYDQGFLAPIHAVGSPNATRSHFDAQDYMETAVPGNKGVHDGWLTRTIAACPQDRETLEKTAKNAIKVVSITPQLPRSLSGEKSALVIPSLETFGINDGEKMGKRGLKRREMLTLPRANAGAASSFESLYAGAVGDVLHGAGEETFDALKRLKELNPRGYEAKNGAVYGNSQLGNSLRQIAQLIKADVGLEVAFTEIGGWDTHAGQGNSNGILARRFGDLASAMSGFWRDLGDQMDDVVVLTMSEFGRTARQNGNGGTDHGHGTAFLLMGGQVAGGQVLGDWPGLAPDQLYENRDLAVTTDFRRVFGEVAARHLGVSDLKSAFPEIELSPRDFRGVLKV